MCCKVHAELTSGRVTYSTVELQSGNFEGGKNIFTSDVWRNGIDFDMRPNEKLISTIKEDLLRVPRYKNKVNTHFRAMTDILLKIFESILHNFKQVSPKLDRPRGLIDFGRAILKT
jgi:hypothetical protein